MKKLVLILLSGIMLLSGCSFIRVAPVSKSKVESTPAAVMTPEPKAEPQKDAGVLGKYEVKIVSAEMDKTYDGKPAVLVTLEWKNNSDMDIAYISCLATSVYQDGIECKTTVLDLKSKLDAQKIITKIKTGKSLQVQLGFELNDTTTPVSVEVSQLISLDQNAKVVKDFNLK